MSGSKIAEGLNEALAWTEGRGTMRVTMPGQPARDLTFEEYRQHDEATQGQAMKELKTSPALLAAIERARTHVMSPAEARAQRRSWVIGQVGLDWPGKSREEVEAFIDHVLARE